MGRSKAVSSLLLAGLLLSLSLSALSLLLTIRGEPAEAPILDDSGREGPVDGETHAANTLADETALLREELRWMNERVRRLEGDRAPRDKAGESVAAKARPIEPEEKEKPLTVEGEAIEDFLRDGGYDDFLKCFGKPEKERKQKDGSLWLHYYRKGIKAHVDYYGKVLKVQFFGEARSDYRTAGGRWEGLYDSAGEWYRPSRTLIDGVSPGMHVTEVFEKWGAPDKRRHQAGGTELMIYESRNLVLKVDEDYKVFEMEFTAK